MTSRQTFLTIDDEGTIARVRASFAAMPQGIERARKRAMKKLMTWIKRQVMREVAKAAGTTQKTFKTLLRYQATSDPIGNINIWIGTNPVGAHFLGKVSWSRKRKGAKAGKHLFPGTWSWGEGSKTKTAIMKRSLSSDPDSAIERESFPIHDSVVQAVTTNIQPQMAERFERLMRQELNYALKHEGAKAA
jgi:hypothetical protein